MLKKKKKNHSAKAKDYMAPTTQVHGKAVHRKITKNGFTILLRLSGHFFVINVKKNKL
jgi:hypothetical protein